MTTIRGSLDPKLVTPGGRFEVGVESVLGEPMEVFVNRARSLRTLVERSARYGDTIYIVHGDRRITYAEHARAVASVAAALRDSFGIGRGDRVAILAANCPEWIVAFWATVSLGAVAVGLNGWWAADEIRYGLDDCEPGVLIADRRRLERLGGAAGVPTIGIESGFGALWDHDPGAALPDVAIDEDDPALILYTSGTTGRPKGAVHSHRNVIALVDVNTYNAARRARASGSGSEPPPVRAFLTNPLFHVSGLHNGAVALLAQGATTIWNVGRFDPATAMATMERERATNWSIVATTAWRVVNHPDAGRYDLSSVTHVGGGASPISGALQQRIREVFPNVQARLGIGYGLTECTSLATIAGGPDLIANPDTVGRPIATTELEIRGPDGTVLGEGEEGEIHVRSPLVMLGYWRNPEATDAVILPGRWLRTGDIGRLRDGQLFLAARRTDLILRGGENVYPAEIENCLEAHPGVRECAVLGVANEELGQEVVGVVVPKDGAQLTGAALTEYVGAHLAAFKVPSRWILRDEALPRNATGKLLRHVLAGAGEATFVEE